MYSTPNIHDYASFLTNCRGFRLRRFLYVLRIRCNVACYGRFYYVHVVFVTFCVVLVLFSIYYTHTTDTPNPLYTVTNLSYSPSATWSRV
jgi:hypothetical protein